MYGVLNLEAQCPAAGGLAQLWLLEHPCLREEKGFAPATVEELPARGADVREQAIEAIPSDFCGGADPRREGVVMGD